MFKTVIWRKEMDSKILKFSLTSIYAIVMTFEVHEGHKSRNLLTSLVSDCFLSLCPPTWWQIMMKRTSPFCSPVPRCMKPHQARTLHRSRGEIVIWMPAPESRRWEIGEKQESRRGDSEPPCRAGWRGRGLALASPLASFFDASSLFPSTFSPPWCQWLADVQGAESTVSVLAPSDNRSATKPNPRPSSIASPGTLGTSPRPSGKMEVSGSEQVRLGPRTTQGCGRSCLAEVAQNKKHLQCAHHSEMAICGFHVCMSRVSHVCSVCDTGDWTWGLHTVLHPKSFLLLFTTFFLTGSC